MVRFKNRYMLFEMIWTLNEYVDESLSGSEVNRVIKDAVVSGFGDFGMGNVIGSLSGVLSCLDWIHSSQIF